MDDRPNGRAGRRKPPAAGGGATMNCSPIERLLADVAGAGHETYLAEMRGRYAFLLKRIGETVGRGTVLDVGASPGLFTELLRRSGFDAVGIDLHPDKRFPRAAGGEHANLFAAFGIPVVKSDVATEPFPFRDAAFDAVMMNETIEHLVGSPLRCLEEIRRVLRPAGRLFLTTPNVASLSNRLKFLCGRNIYTPVEVLVNVQPYKLHNREYTMGEILDLLRRAGLRVIEKGHYNFGGAPAGAAETAAKKAYYALTALFPAGRSNIYVCAAPESTQRGRS
ncbi:MAG: class I SAM-dependent methyltransferase [bacterium]